MSGFNHILKQNKISNMKNTRKSNLRLGLFVGVGLILFILGIYYIGSQGSMFSRNIMLSGVFKDISGVKIGNDVRFSGINIGTVSRVEIINDSLVRIDLSIQQNEPRLL